MEDCKLFGVCIKTEKKDIFEMEHICIKKEHRVDGKCIEFASMYEIMI